MVKAIWPRYGRSKFGPPPLVGSHRFMRTSIKQKRDFEFAHFPVSAQKTAAGFELSGARLPQNRRRFLRGKRGCVGFWNVLKYTAQYIIRSIMYYNVLKYTEGPLMASARGV